MTVPALAVGLISLPAILDIQASAALRDDMLRALAEGAVSLDGAAVERVSTACLQVIASAAAGAADQGASFGLRRASPALAAAIADLGLSPAIPQED